MTRGYPSTAVAGAVGIFFAWAVLVVPPVYGQTCTPSSDSGTAARSGASLTNEAGQTIVVNRAGERGLDASTSATNRGTVITCGDVREYVSDGRPARRRGHAVTVSSQSGDATALNERTTSDANSGLIETRGRAARGLQADTYSSDTGTARATNRGRVVTRGDIYDGTDHYGSPHYRTADGVAAFINSPWNRGDALTVNERNSANDTQSGVIEVHGTGARGMWAYTKGTGEARGINRGDITTHGNAFAPSGGYGGGSVHSAAGIAAESHGGDATAINAQGATIRTHGDGAPGLFAISSYPETGAGTDAPRAARAENHGTIHVSGSTVYRIEHDGDGEVEMEIGSLVAGAHAMAYDGTATVLNTGNVKATGSEVAGLAATDDMGREEDHSGLVDEAVDVVVRMTGGSVTAGARDNPETAEDESGRGIGIYAVSDSGSARVSVSGESTTVTAYGAKTDNPDTEDFDEREGVGIAASGERDSGDDTLVEVSGGATVTADVAVRAIGTLNLYESRLNGRVELGSRKWETNDHFTIRGGSVDGGVKFHDGGKDVLTIKNHGHITGGVDFGEGMDTLVFNVEGTGDQTSRIDGHITGLEKMYKRGRGTARVRDVTFSGSALALEEGGLTLAGHLNLGADGTLTVHDESRLTIEVGDITKDPTDHGTITAGGGVIYEGLGEQETPELFMQIGSEAAERREAIQAQLQQEGTRIDVLGRDTEVVRRDDPDSLPVAAEATLRTVGDDGTTQDIGTLSSDGTAMVQLDDGEDIGIDGMPPEDTTPPLRRDDDSSSNAGALLIGVGAAALAVYLFDLFDSEEPAFVEWEESWTGSRSTTSFAGIRSGHYHEHRVRTGALEQWTRAFAGGSGSLAGGVEGTVQGMALGLDATLPRGFNVGVSMMPDMAVSARRGPALKFGANVEGGRYALHGGWRGDALFVDTNLSHGSYRTHSFIENPAVGGLLGGELNLVQNHARGRAGVRFDLGLLRATPSVSLFSGSLRQGAYTARGAAVSAEVPGISQRYSGWRAKLDLAPSGWLDGPGALNWRPSLHLGTTRTRTSGPRRLDVRQSDHEGVLSFASRAVVKGLPRTVHGIGASLAAARSDAWTFRVGYAGMVVDGEPVHAAVARFRMRF